MINTFLTQKNYPSTGLKAVLFDMDGVLFDSMKNHSLAWYRTMSGRGMICSQEEFYLYEGSTGKGTINLFYNRTLGRDATDEEVKEIYAEKSIHFNSLPEPEVMPGAQEIVNKVIARGLEPILVTGSGQKTLLNRLNRYFPNVFRFGENMVTAFDVTQGKPHPEPYLRGLEKADAKPWQAIVVENAPLGTQAGVAAGIFTVTVNTGPIPDDMLLKSGCNLLLPNMNTLANQIDEIIDSFEK